LGKCFFADFSTTEGIKLFFQQALEYLGQIDILVNNAAGYDNTSFLNLNIDKFESVLKVSLKQGLAYDSKPCSYHRLTRKPLDL
jgi:NAD(P)-dependent dehydrogenase (short-subunit alcohol dehydrogenase family)